ncbi:MAG: M16 family metallopeptidase [Candidatus Krumholzibacteriota bacterium]
MRRPFPVPVLMFILIFSISGRCPGSETGTAEIPGGPRLIADIHPGSPAVCVTVSVGAGSAVETPEVRGITHFIEHMAFNGSERFSRSDISGWVDDNGVFLNAFTRKERTVFFILARSEIAGEAVEILSEMLLHSVFPPSEIEKERNVILEEIRETMDNPRHARDRLAERYLYGASPLAQPVLGYPETINNISREKLTDYYRKYYTPSNMTVFVMGGIGFEKAHGLVRDYFGSFRTSDGTERKPLVPGCMVRYGNTVRVRSNERFEEGLDLLIRIKGARSRVDRLAAGRILLSLVSGDNSPFRKRLQDMGVRPPQSSIELHGDCCSFRFSFAAGKGGAGDLKAIPAVLEELSDWKPDRNTIESAVKAYIASDLFDREKYHYYLMLHGEEMAYLGESYFVEYLEGIKEVSEDQIGDVLEKSFSEMEYNGCIFVKEQKRDFRKAVQFDSRTLDNGVEIASIRRTGSEVAALHMLIENGNCIWGPEEAGLPSLIHTALEASAGETGLNEKLDRLGSRVSWGDNPYIPMDDYLLNRSYTFIRLEAPLSNFREAAGQLIEHVAGARLSEELLGGAMAELRRETMIREGNPLFRLRERFYRELFPGHPFGGSIFPSGRLEVTSDSISCYRRDYLSGNNIIATLVSGLPEDEAEGLLSDLLGEIAPGGGSAGCPPFPEQAAAGRRKVTAESGGAYLLAGFAGKQLDPGETAAVAVASEVLDRRMKNQIRENRGLAYSTGCNFKLMKGGFVVEIHLGTRSSNLNEASEAMMEELASLLSDKPGEDEIEVAVSRICSERARRELSSINQAYAAGLDIYCLSGNRFVNVVAEAGVDEVRRVIEDFFDPDRIFYLEMVPEQSDSGEKTGFPGMK